MYFILLFDAFLLKIVQKKDGNIVTVLRAQDETRTHTILRPLPPQSSVYTNFTTCASRQRRPQRASAQNRTRTCTPRGMRT